MASQSQRKQRLRNELGRLNSNLCTSSNQCDKRGKKHNHWKIIYRYNSNQCTTGYTGCQHHANIAYGLTAIGWRIKGMHLTDAEFAARYKAS
jgi:hypothetical protein